jgi:hypothetical protein
MSKPSHRAEKRTLKTKRTNITGRAGALMDLIVPKSRGQMSQDSKKGVSVFYRLPTEGYTRAGKF